MVFDQGRGNQGPRGPGQGRRRRRSRGRSQGPAQRPPQPPSFIQRDILLIPSQESLAKIQAVRSQFDPLALKVSPHITLLEPEPRGNIQNDYLKKLNLDELPKLNDLKFEKVVVHNNVFLWMIPSPESAERLSLWRDALIQGLPPQPNRAVEEFIPHITLGYLTRDLSAEETLKIAREKLEIPGAFFFAKLLLEEFGDNQASVPIDSRPL